MIGIVSDGYLEGDNQIGVVIEDVVALFNGLFDVPIQFLGAFVLYCKHPFQSQIKLIAKGDSLLAYLVVLQEGALEGDGEWLEESMDGL